MKLKIGDKVKIKNSDDKTIWEITKIDKSYKDEEFVSCMIDTSNEENYSDLAWFEEELELAEVQMPNLTKEQVVKVVEDYFDWQFKTQVGLLVEATEDNNYEFINDYLKTLNNINNILNDIDLLAYRYKESED